MRYYKLLLFLNLFVNVNPFMIRHSTSNHNLYKLSRTYSTIFTNTPTITNNLKKVSSQPQLNFKSFLIKSKKDNNDDNRLKEIIIINFIKGIIFYNIYHYIFHII
jgi:hypothetical protein